nr:UvrD-like helicase, ATP-binding domain, P-loop containing nucleoside triphosphate hydrolase [Tanacetum cinerariifolium]
MNFLTHTASLEASKAAIYSASADEVANMLCLALFQSTAPSFETNTYHHHPSDIQHQYSIPVLRVSFAMHSFRSKEDHVVRISKSVFVTNFLDNFGSRDLWKLCEVYGKVVDVLIHNHKSKASKRFAFVRFIRVEDLDRLIGNLGTLLVGHFHLHANAVRSYVAAVNGTNIPHFINAPFSCSPALVLDDTCVNTDDLSRYVMGKDIDLNSIPNLHTILTKEGFTMVQLSYLGSLWVLIEVKNETTKQKLLQHTGANSWFHVLQDAIPDFVSDEGIVWVDIEGIPLKIWSQATFAKIGKRWGEVMDIDETPGKVNFVRAKELFTWTLCFLEYKESGYVSDDESIHDTNNKPDESQLGGDALVGESDDEGV